MKKLLLIVLGLTLFSAAVVKAQGFATVDTRLLLILHPSMVGFDYRVGAFFRIKEPDKISTEVLKQLQIANKEAEKANETIDKEIANVNLARIEVLNNLTKEEQVFGPGELEKMKKRKKEFETALKELKNKVVSAAMVQLQNSKIAALEEKISNIDKVLGNPSSLTPDEQKIKAYKEQLNRLNQKILALQSKKLDNLDRAMSAVYLTKAENEERLTQIRKEINQIIGEVAKKEGCTLVIDDSYAVRDPDKKDKNIIMSDINENQDTHTSSLFYSLLNYAPDTGGLADDTSMTEQQKFEHLALGGALSLNNQLKQYLEVKNYLPEKVSDFTFGSLFISGGKNLTALCAARIFDKYNIPDYTRQRFKAVIAEYITGNQN